VVIIVKMYYCRMHVIVGLLLLGDEDVLIGHMCCVIVECVSIGCVGCVLL